MTESVNLSPLLLWQPDTSTRCRSHLAKYLAWIQKNGSASFLENLDLEKMLDDPEKSAQIYHAAWKWSTENPAQFWESLWNYFEIRSETPFTEVLTSRRMPGARWFEGATINYAAEVFRRKNADQPAILFADEHNRKLQEISWSELENRTAALASQFISWGIQPGDRIAAFLPNTPHAVIGALAALSVGAVWSSCSPDFGASSVADRFAQIEPKVLIAVDGYHYNGKAFDKSQVVMEITALLPSVEKVIWVPFLKENSDIPADIPNAISWQEALKYPAGDFSPIPVPFSHPIWILFSSGTTGIPKAITHSHGGNLLEHLKYTHFHNDIHPGERFFWYSTTGWMMWNFTMASLLAGATIVLYDGSAGFPGLDALWQLAADAPIHHFGASAPFLVSCMKAGLEPGMRFDLSALRSIGSTGSPLPPEAFAWVYQAVKPGVWLSSMSGGTDVCTAWVGGNPLLPVYQGEIQCRCLGCAMESWDENGMPTPDGEVGEMVVTEPMPSMPIFFWNDADGSKYYNSYFDTYPGIWRHGDWMRITPREGVVILGRSDATLNRQGVRIGTAEIYRALDRIAEIRDSLIVNIEFPDGTDTMPLFIALAPEAILDEPLKNRIRQTLRTTYSPRHVPDAIIEAPDIPYTISGKKMEMPVKKILMHKPLEKAFNRDSMKNPEAMEFYINFAEQFPFKG